MQFVCRATKQQGPPVPPTPTETIQATPLTLKQTYMYNNHVLTHTGSP